MQPVTWVDLLRARAAACADPLLQFESDDPARPAEHLSHADLDTAARPLAAVLQDAAPAGARVVTICPQGRAFLTSFFGCLYAGMVAVPAPPPASRRGDRAAARLAAIIADARPAALLATAAVAAVARPALARLGVDTASLTWILVDEVPAEAAGAWQAPTASAGTPAVLQYTSGSTSAPRGVVLTHANLLANVTAIRQAFDCDAEDVRLVTWLPPSHDMGLVGGLLVPIAAGRPLVVLPPSVILQRPLRWLETIARTGATHSGGPPFAFQACIRQIPCDRVAAIDLSRWRVAYVGAERVRADVLRAFAAFAAPAGFRSAAFSPCYGLAEAALLVSGGAVGSGPAVRRFPERDGATSDREWVGAGPAAAHTSVRIVHPDTCVPCSLAEVGEIWVAGPGVADGYFDNAEATQAAFGWALDDDPGSFLRTGDLGRIDQGQLFVMGRRKELVIIRGVNHYPQDIEDTVESSDSALQPGAGVACAIDAVDGEGLLILQELTRHGERVDLDAVIAHIRQAVVEVHEIDPSAIVVVPPGGLPRTTSGKVQRSLARDGWLDGSLQMRREWRATDVRPAPVDSSNASVSPTAEDIRAWLRTRIGDLVGALIREEDCDRPLASLGLDSRRAMQLAAELETWLGRRVPVTLAYQHPTIGGVARALAGEASPARSVREVLASADGMSEPIAIIGIGCRFPRASGPAAFWELLVNGVDAIREVPTDRWDAARYYDPDPAAPGKTNSRWGGFLDQVDRFDTKFFGISPHEAARMDPQQRLLLEVAWEALEDAGIPPPELAGSLTGVFVGISTTDYGLLQAMSPLRIDGYSATGGALSIAANRLSYVLDLAGPSLAIDTACSSSLVAVHAACQSLRIGESTLALAGGVNVILSPALGINFTKAGVSSPDGRCRPFDADANGFVRGEGAGLVLLKPLSRAIADGDRIYAVIRGSAVNQDGRTNGLMAPNPASQARVVREACRLAAVEPSALQYVETHGTSTSLGDPIEANTLGALLAEGRGAAAPCPIGSVKSNIGHLEAASGVAGLIKAALCVHHGRIPASLHFKTPSPHIAFADLPIRVPTTCEAWSQTEHARLAGISSFGFGGTNAHVIIESAPKDSRCTAAAESGPWLLPFSAPTPEALDAVVRGGARLAATVDPDRPLLRDVAWTLSVRRTHHACRRAFVARDWADLAERLERSRDAVTVRDGRRAPLVWVFPGLGAQFEGMGAAMYRESVAFRAAVDACDMALRPYLSWSVAEAIANGRRDWRDVDVVQPTMFAVQMGWAALWRSYGVEADAVVGHSMGEVSAACVAGALDLDAAARVMARRAARLKSLTDAGGMLAVDRDTNFVSALLAESGLPLSIAASNGPSITVVSGALDAIGALHERLASAGADARILQSPVGSHGPLMAPLEAPLQSDLGGLFCRHPRLSMASSVTGGMLDGMPLDASYWWRNLREPVLFRQAIDALIDGGHSTFLEVSPHPTLCGAVQETIDHRRLSSGLVLPSSRREPSDGSTTLGSVGALYARGHDIVWRAVMPDVGRCVSLPLYPWQRERCWLAPPAEPDSRVAPWPLLAKRVASPDRPAVRQWALDLGLGDFDVVDAHRVGGQVIVPAVLFLEMALEAARDAFGAGALALERVEFLVPLALDGSRRVTLQIVLAPHSEKAGRFEIYAASREGWTLHVSGLAAIALATRVDGSPALRRLASGVPRYDRDALYAALRARGLDYGHALQRVDQLWGSAGEAVATLTSHDARQPNAEHGYVIDPAMLDASLHAIAGFESSPADRDDATPYLPARVASLWVDASPSSICWSYARRSPETADDAVVVDVTQIGASDGVIARLTGLELQRAGESAARAGVPWARWLYQPIWTPAPLDQATRPAEDVFVLGPPELATPLVSAFTARGHRARAIDPNSPLAAGVIVDVRSFVATAPEDACADVAALARDLAARSSTTSESRLWVVTAGSERDPGAALSGLCRTLALEHPELRCSMITPGVGVDGWLEHIVDEVAADTIENDVMYRDGDRHVQRLVPATVGSTARRLSVPAEPFRLRAGAAGAMRLESSVPGDLGSDQIEIRVDAAGLNFRDVLGAMGLLATRGQTPGFECAGRIHRLGAGVAGFAVGDAVVAIAPSACAELAVTRADLVVRMPTGLATADAATIPVAFLTAAYGLERLARVRSGERVLIHSASGGVGLAAVQIAQRMGAEVLATAGSDARRDYLRSIGIAHVFDSRSAAFVEGARDATDGRGVDVVLNSLTGELLKASLSLLAPGGRFVDLGLPQPGARHAFDLEALPANAAVVSLRLDEIVLNWPGQIGELLRDLVSRIERGELAPLPRTLVPIGDAARAFDLFLRRAHMGKVVVDVGSARRPMPPLREDATYLLTGGLGGLGLKVAERLVTRGARNLVLVGRRAPNADARDVIDHLRGAGARVEVVSADVSVEADVSSLLAQIGDTMPPLRGIVHAAAVLSDATVANLTHDHFVNVFGAKATAARHLDRLSQHQPLDFFVGFSSAAAVIGAPGQGNYAAANATLDAVVLARHAQGHAAVTINWGPWAEAGQAADVGRSRHLALAGIEWIPVETGLDIFECALDGSLGPQVAVIHADWHAVSRDLGVPPPLLADLMASADSSSASRPSTALLRTTIAAAPGDTRQALLAVYLRDQLAELLGTTPERLPIDEPLDRFGFDSLMAIQMKNRVARDLDAPLSLGGVMRGQTIDDIARQLAQAMPGEPSLPDTRELESLLAAVEAMDDPSGEPPIELLSDRNGEAAAEPAIRPAPQ